MLIEKQALFFPLNITSSCYSSRLGVYGVYALPGAAG